MDGKAYYDRGIENHDKENYKQAIADFTEAIRLKPSSAGAYSRRAASYFCRGDNDLAISDYSKAIELGPGDEYSSDDYKNRGVLYASKDQIDKAMADFNKAVSLDPDNCGAYFARGCGYATVGEYSKAKADFEEALRKNPMDPDVIRWKLNAVNDILQKRKGDCKMDWFSNEGMDRKMDWEVYFDKGIAYVDECHFEEAIKEFTKVIELKPNFAWAYRWRGRSYACIEDDDSAIPDHKKPINLAISDFSEAIKLAQSDKDAIIMYGDRALAYVIKGQSDDAIADYSEMIRLDSNNGDAYSKRGLEYAKKGEYSKAKADFEEAMKKNPSDLDDIRQSLKVVNEILQEKELKNSLQQGLKDIRDIIELRSKLAAQKSLGGADNALREDSFGGRNKCNVEQAGCVVIFRNSISGEIIKRVPGNKGVEWGGIVTIFTDRDGTQVFDMDNGDCLGDPEEYARNGRDRYLRNTGRL